MSILKWKTRVLGFNAKNIILALVHLSPGLKAQFMTNDSFPTKMSVREKKKCGVCQITTWKQPCPHLGAPYFLAQSWKQTPKWKQMLSDWELLHAYVYSMFSSSLSFSPALSSSVAKHNDWGLEKWRVKWWWSKWKNTLWNSHQDEATVDLKVRKQRDDFPIEQRSLKMQTEMRLLTC